MWLFILMELTAFGLFFLTFSVTQNLNTAMFQAGQATLHPLIGLICTLALITSSYFVALSLIKVKLDDSKGARNRLWIALAIACIYIVAKMWEYIQLGQLGYDLSTNTFYTLYFFTTAFHFMHVILGMVILTYMAIRAGKNAYSSHDHDGFEAGACYWHMVDLVWVILFPLIYIIH